MPAAAVTFNGGGGTDTLVGANVMNTWKITGLNAGTVGKVTFHGVENLVGGHWVDTFKFSAGGSIAGSIQGGGAPARMGDWLDYSALATAVTVNLATGSATGVGGTATNVQAVRGGKAGNTLTGNAAGNILIGADGRHPAGDGCLPRSVSFPHCWSGKRETALSGQPADCA